MRGHLTERRPGVWRLVVSDGFEPDGARRQITRTVHGSKRDAQRALTAMLKERDEGRLADGRQSLARYLTDEWLPAVSAVSKRGRPLAPTTRQRYQDAVSHISRVIGRVRLQELRPSHVEHLRDVLLKRLAPQTVSDLLRVLAQALSRAEARGLVGRNAASPVLVNRPAGEPRDFVVVTPRLGMQILEAVRGVDPWDAVAHLALGLGLRREEILGLRWTDVDRDKVAIRRTLTAAGGEIHFGPPKSRAGERDVLLPGFVEGALQRHRKAQRTRLLRAGIGPVLVVDRGDGGPWFPASLSTGWRRFAKRHGWGVTLHGLRHGSASLLLAAGVPDAVAMSVLGHADARILRHYQGVAEELKRDAARRMDRLLGEQAP